MFETVEIKDVKKELGQLVKLIRKSRKLSQVELANSISVSKTTIANLESGRNFTIDTILKVVKELDLLTQLNQEIGSVKNQIESTKSLY